MLNCFNDILYKNGGSDWNTNLSDDKAKLFTKQDLLIQSDWLLTALV